MATQKKGHVSRYVAAGVEPQKKYVAAVYEAGAPQQRVLEEIFASKADARAHVALHFPDVSRTRYTEFASEQRARDYQALVARRAAQSVGMVRQRRRKREPARALPDADV